jgi:hypothetical protein
MRSRVWLAAVVAAVALNGACSDATDPTDPSSAALNRSKIGHPGSYDPPGKAGRRGAHDDRDVHRIYGRPVQVGNGHARSYIAIRRGTPVEVGVALSERAMDGLPAPTGTTPDSHMYLLPLPAWNPTQYQLVELDWNPAGHPPPMVYTVPHFDFHFYRISQAERDAIVPGPDFAARTDNLPPERYRPANYQPDSRPDGSLIGVPMMGLHWENMLGPEFHGVPFTSTFIYGSWDGTFTFDEPMVTYAYLMSHPDTVGAIEVPAHFQYRGYHPTSYRVVYDRRAREYRVAVSDLKRFW